MELKTFISKKEQTLAKLIKEENFNFTLFSKALKNKDVKINGTRTSNKDISLSVNDKVEIYYLPLEKKPLDIKELFRDENVLVVDKPKKITSDDFYKEILKRNTGAKFIHRLDRNTSGVMIFALNEDAEKELLSGFKNRTFKKIYFAEVVGKLQVKQAVLTAYLKKDSEKSLVTIFDKKVKDSHLIKTGYKVIKEREFSTDLEVELFTGKTHQIRAHLAHIGHPIVGDGKYGQNQVNKQFLATEQRLCSWKLTLFFNNDSPLYYLNNKHFVSTLKED